VQQALGCSRGLQKRSINKSHTNRCRKKETHWRNQLRKSNFPRCCRIFRKS